LLRTTAKSVRRDVLDRGRRWRNPIEAAGHDPQELDSGLIALKQN